MGSHWSQYPAITVSSSITSYILNSGKNTRLLETDGFFASTSKAHSKNKPAGDNIATEQISLRYPCRACKHCQSISLFCGNYNQGWIVKLFLAGGTTTNQTRVPIVCRINGIVLRGRHRVNAISGQISSTLLKYTPLGENELTARKSLNKGRAILELGAPMKSRKGCYGTYLREQ